MTPRHSSKVKAPLNWVYGIAYFLWGPRDYTGDIVIVLGDVESAAREHFNSVTVAATLNNPYAYRYENRPVLLCQGLKWNLQKEWSRGQELAIRLNHIAAYSKFH